MSWVGVPPCHPITQRLIAFVCLVLLSFRRSAPGGDRGRARPLYAGQILQGGQYNRVEVYDKQRPAAEQLRHVEARRADAKLRHPQRRN